jgi:hypothetical protein
MNTHGSRRSAAFALATLVALSGVVGCGRADKGRGGATVPAGAVEVTYYYLPG